MLPANIPNIPVSDMPQELREEIVVFLERGRHDLHLTNLVYAAAHTLLRGVPVERAEVSLGDWELLQSLLPELAPPAAQKEVSDFYRNTKMIARLGDIAIDMRASVLKQAGNAPDEVKSVLLFASGRAHTPRLAERFHDKISFKTII